MAFMKLKGKGKDVSKPDSVSPNPTNQPQDDCEGDGDGGDDSETAPTSEETAVQLDPNLASLQAIVDDLDASELQFLCTYADQKLQELDKEKNLNDQGKEFDSKEYEKPVAPSY